MFNSSNILALAGNVPALGACGGLSAPKLNRKKQYNEPQQ